ncbi:MAG: CHASE domain-containing protein [Anaerolineae bacterium]|nr:CHASE domain-containing protein [Anaerolineae bacterium]
MAQALPAYAKPPRSALRRYPVALALIVGLTLSVIAYIFIRNRQVRLVQLEFQQQAGDYASAVRRNLDDHLAVLEAIGPFYAASQSVERNEFQAFVQAALRRQPNIQALYWIPRVTLAQRSTYESVAAQDGLTNFAIVERGGQDQWIRVASRKEYYPIFYVEPLVDNTQYLGYDLASNPEMWQALASARDSGQMTATRWNTETNGGDGSNSSLILLPIYFDASLAVGLHQGGGTGPASAYQPPLDPSLVAQRRRSLYGFAAIALPIDSIVLAALRAQNGPPMRVSLVSLPLRRTTSVPETDGDPAATLPSPQPARSYTPIGRRRPDGAAVN